MDDDKTRVFCSNQLGNCRQMDLSGLGIDVKLKEKKRKMSSRLMTYLIMLKVALVGTCFDRYLLSKQAIFLS